MDYSNLLFPPNQIRQMKMYTSQQLVKHGEKGTNNGETIKWFGIIILATCFEFGDRASLWSTVSKSKYRYAPAFGKTGMNRHRFNMLWTNVQWIHHTDIRDEGTGHESHLWKLVEDFVTIFNEYHTQVSSSSDLICADDSISR